MMMMKTNIFQQPREPKQNTDEAPEGSRIVAEVGGRGSAFRAVAPGGRGQLVPLVCGLCPDWLLPSSLLLPLPRACLPGCTQCGPHC